MLTWFYFRHNKAHFAQSAVSPWLAYRHKCYACVSISAASWQISKALSALFHGVGSSYLVGSLLCLGVCRKAVDLSVKAYDVAVYP